MHICGVYPKGEMGRAYFSCILHGIKVAILKKRVDMGWMWVGCGLDVCGAIVSKTTFMPRCHHGLSHDLVSWKLSLMCLACGFMDEVSCICTCMCMWRCDLCILHKRVCVACVATLCNRHIPKCPVAIAIAWLSREEAHL